VPFARIRFAVCTALLLVTGCSSEVVFPNTGTEGIEVVDGNGQSGQVRQLLPLPVIVKATDADGQPLANAGVEFAFVSAGEGAEISPPNATTDASGQAKAFLLLGDKLGIQTGEAHLMIDGASASKATFTAVASPANPDNRAPNADFNWHCDDLSCQFTDGSSDPDGDVTAWDWQFGDGERSDQAEPAHAYAAPGRYTVTLTVSDNEGATDQTATEVDVSVSSPPPSENKAPHAEFDVHCRDRFCSFVDKSRDDDGDVVSWSWNFGDGSSSDARNPFHFYPEDGKYDVTLTVTDDGGASDTKSHHADAD
jgi:PKD repeat protein